VSFDWPGRFHVPSMKSATFLGGSVTFKACYRASILRARQTARGVKTSCRLNLTAA
jgi:hypothetical protein